MKAKLLLKSARRLFSSQPLPQPIAINLEAAPHELFKAYTESFKTHTAQLVQSLTPEETAYFEKCFSALNSLTPDEKAYFFYRYFSESELSLEELRAGLTGQANPYNPFQIDQLGASRGAGGAKASTQSKQAEGPKSQEAPKEEPKKEVKTNVDVELTAVDASKKIAIIKEIKNVLGVGLKEAKDLVEGGAAIIKKGMLVQEAEELQAKLTAIGCTITLK